MINKLFAAASLMASTQSKTILPDPNQEYDDNVLVSKVIEADGTHVATYDWTAVDSNKACTRGTKCFGW